MKHGKKPETDVQDPLSDLESRISAVIGLFRSRKEAASIAGMSADQLARYEKGSTPSFPPLIKLAKAKGVSMEWLATGEGEMQMDAAHPASQQGSQNERPEGHTLQPDLIASAVRITDDVLRKYGIRDLATAQQFGDLVAVVYEDLVHGKANQSASEGLDRIMDITRRMLQPQ